MMRRIQSISNMTRLLLIILLASIVLAGCVSKKKLPPPPEPTHFVTVIPEQGESLSDIADQYLGDSSLSFRISEFNDISSSVPNQPLVVPLKPSYTHTG